MTLSFSLVRNANIIFFVNYFPRGWHPWCEKKSTKDGYTQGSVRKTALPRYRVKEGRFHEPENCRREGNSH